MPEAQVPAALDNNLSTAAGGTPAGNNEPTNGSTPTPTPTGEDNTPAPEPKADASDESAESAESTEKPAAGTDASKKAPWFQRRIDALTAEKWEERRTNEALKKQTEELLAQLAEARKGGAAPAADTVPATTTPPANNQQPAPVKSDRTSFSDAELNALVEQKAEQRARQKAFDTACNNVYTNGKDEFGDFDQALRTFQMLGGIPTSVLEVATEMPDAHKVLYALAKDPDLAERVVKMSPAKQALELARLESQVSKPPTREVSRAPNPVKPIDGSSRASDDMEKVTMDEFVKMREKQIAARRR